LVKEQEEVKNNFWWGRLFQYSNENPQIFSYLSEGLGDFSSLGAGGRGF